MLAKILKKIPIPTFLAAGIWTGYSGDLPLMGARLDEFLSGWDVAIYEGVKYPVVFSVFSSLAFAWLVYLIIVVVYGGQRMRARLRLVAMRDEGSKLRVRGKNMMDANDLEPWINDINNWHDRVVSALSKIDKADAGQYKTLDVSGKPRFHLPNYLNTDHRHFYIIIDKKLVLLERYMDKYGGTA